MALSINNGHVTVHLPLGHVFVTHDHTKEPYSLRYSDALMPPQVLGDILTFAEDVRNGTGLGETALEVRFSVEGLVKEALSSNRCDGDESTIYIHQPSVEAEIAVIKADLESALAYINSLKRTYPQDLAP